MDLSKEPDDRRDQKSFEAELEKLRENKIELEAKKQRDKYRNRKLARARRKREKKKGYRN